MNDSEYGFLFKPNGNEEQGPSNSGEEIFSDDTIAKPSPVNSARTHLTRLPKMTHGP